MFRVFLLTALACVLAACATTAVDPNYDAYVQFQRDVQAERDARLAAVSDVSACQGDASCVIATKAIAALAETSGGGRGSGIQPYQKQPSTLDRILGITQAVLVPAMNAYVSLEQSRNARDISLAQYDFLGDVASTAGETAVRLAEAGPRIEVGGNYGDTFGEYVGGNRTEVGGNLGDTYGDDTTGGDRTDIGGDNVGGDRAGDGSNIGDNNRIDSPGPIDNECAGGDGADGGDGGTGGTQPGGNGGNGAPGGACSNGSGG